MLSVSCKAGIKAVIYLGSKYESGEKSGIREVAEFIDENEHTVGKLLQKLVKDEIINSAKGPNGGFFITARQLNQPIIHIVESIDGKDIFKQCGLGLTKCSDTKPCPFHDDFKQVRKMFEKICSEKKIADLQGVVQKGEAYLFN
jgi:Rrf2 family protein